ncbi:MAG: YbaY family lipoprotein [Moraxellaceae bacterium]|nr:YbaY family lipoprotein [Moraxellaceae bacterium]
MRVLFLSPLLFLAGCQIAPPEAPLGPSTEYICSNAARIGTQISPEGDVMRLRIRGESHTLGRRGESEPRQWSDGRYTVEEKEKGVRVVIAGELLGLNCQPLQRQPAEAGKQAASMAMLGGTLNYRQRIALSPEAVITLRLVDVSKADAPAVVIAEQVLKSPGQVPIPFALPYDERRIDAARRYAVQVRIEEAGELRFVTARHYGVLTQGNPFRADIWLDMVPPTAP